jgi:hypothetical protein
MMQSTAVLLLFSLLGFLPGLVGFRRLNQSSSLSEGAYFRPYTTTPYVGRFGDPNNFQRERTNEGGPGTPEQELLFEGNYPRQICPNMVGPFSDGMYYCTARE